MNKSLWRARAAVLVATSSLWAIPTDSVETKTVETWRIPTRAATAGAGLQDAFAQGAFGVPWVVSPEYEGMYERWDPWPGVSLSQPTRSAGADFFNGAAASGPLAAGEIVSQLRTGFGGLPEWELRPFRTALDTPQTHLNFWRGALGAYRFGLNLERNLVGPWQLRVHMDTRTSRQRLWEYRDQISNSYKNSFGRNDGDLPTSGYSAGQDDVRWMLELVRLSAHQEISLQALREDARRGVPVPGATWIEPIEPLSGKEDLAGWVAQWRRTQGAWQANARLVNQSSNWKAPYWSPDTNTPRTLLGQTDELGMDAEMAWIQKGWRLGASAQGTQWEVSQHDVADSAQSLQESQWRLGGFGELGPRWGQLRLQAGWNQLDDRQARVLGDWDGQAQLQSRTAKTEFVLLGRREVVLPRWELTGRPDPLLRSMPSQGLMPEVRWVSELRAGVRPWSWLLFDASGMVMRSENHLAIAHAPSDPDGTTRSMSDALRLTNAQQAVLGQAVRVGFGVYSRTLHWRTELASGWQGVPGQSFGGGRDRSLPALQLRAAAGWHAPLLDGRLMAFSQVHAHAWSRAWGWVPNSDGRMTQQVLPAGVGVDWENRVQIRTFGIFWKLENLGHVQQMQVVGWTPPGVRSGWGVTWNFGG